MSGIHSLFVVSATKGEVDDFDIKTFDKKVCVFHEDKLCLLNGR